MRTEHIDNKKSYPGEYESAEGSMAFTILRSRYLKTPPQVGGTYGGSKSASITVTRTTLVSSDLGAYQQHPASAWPKPRSNRYVFDLFNHERLVLGNEILVPSQISFGTIGGLTAEGDDKPEATIDLAPVTLQIRKAAVWAKISDETIEDHLGFSAWMNSEFKRQLLSAIDNQLLNGTGVAPQITGLLTWSGVQTQSKGGDTLTVAISKAFGKVLAAGFYPTAILVSPTDFAALTATTPIEFNGTFFGVQLIASEHVVDSLPIVGDFSGGTVFEKSGLVFEATNHDQDDLIMNLTTIRAEQRLALAVFSPPAFCAVVA